MLLRTLQVIEGARDLQLDECSFVARPPRAFPRADDDDDDDEPAPFVPGQPAADDDDEDEWEFTPAEDFDLEAPAGQYLLRLDVPYERYVAVELLELASFRDGCAFTQVRARARERARAARLPPRSQTFLGKTRASHRLPTRAGAQLDYIPMGASTASAKPVRLSSARDDAARGSLSRG